MTILPFVSPAPTAVPTAPLPLWGVVEAGGQIYRVEFRDDRHGATGEPGAMMMPEGSGRGWFALIPLQAALRVVG